MDVTLTTDQQEIAAAARRFLDQRCPLAHARAMAADPRGYDPSLWRQMSELGWLGLVMPEQHGGLGESFVELCLLVEEQGRHLLPSPFLPTVVLGAQAIARFGSPAKQAEHLPAVADGERIIAVARAGLTAARDSDGYALDGTASLVELAASADLFVAIAGESAFLVPARDDRIEVTAQDTGDGIRTACVAFRDMRLPEDAVLGRPGQGAAVAGAIAKWGAAARCAELVGIGRRVLDMTVEYATERVAFGSPIGTFQAVQHHCADMAVDVLTSASVTREAVWRVATDDAGAEETVSIAKAWVSDAIARVCARGHQVHGAIGFTAEHDLHLLSQRARAVELDFGDAASHRDALASRFGL